MKEHRCGTKPKCFGWWADCDALNETAACPVEVSCKQDWVESGGRVGGYFDKRMAEINKI